MRSMIPTLLLAALVSLFVTGVRAQSPLDAVEGAPVSIGTFRLLHSEILGEDRPLLVSLPEDYEAGEASYPVLYVLYGDQVRGYFAEAVHAVERLSGEGSIPEMLVVGVANLDRYRDLSPVGRRGGGSGVEPFAGFVEEELVPFVDSEYRTKDYRVLMGPQAGAGFAVYSLATRPGLFDACIIESPFAFPELNEALAPMLDAIADEGLPSPTFLQVTWADRTGFQDRADSRGLVEAFEARVREADPPNLTLVVNYVDGSEDFLPPLRLKEGLRELFRGHRFPEDMGVRGLSDITDYYEELSGRIGFDIDVPTMTLAASANGLAMAGNTHAAIEILQYLVETHPASVDGHWQLANIYRERGERDKALGHYRKCLELLPNMPMVQRYIEELEGEE